MGATEKAAASIAAQVKKLSFRNLAVDDFVRHLTLKRVVDEEKHAILRAGSNMNFAWGRLFGGQPMSQALSAASATVPSSQLANSFSCKFIREGMMDEHVDYHVEKVRDGRSFATRRVRAVQGHGDILDMLVSFHVQEDGLEHQLRPLPNAINPDGLGPNAKRVEEFARSLGKTVDEIMPKALQDIFLGESQPMLLRPGVLFDIINFADRLPPHQRNWIKANVPFDPTSVEYETDDAILSDLQLSQVMLTFCADFSFLGTSLFPHGTSVWSPKIQPASLSHTMYFHRPFSVQDWLLFEMESPTASSARGFVRGEIYDVKTGQLVASALQEGLIRPRKFRKENKASMFS